MSSVLHSSNVMKDEFGWEVPVESVPLPSKGLIYSPDSVLYNTETLQIKAMTALEEDILSSQAFIKEGTVVENLIKSCLIDKSIDVNNLISGDRNALMVSIRITGYGTDYKVNHTCKSCSKSNDLNVDLSGLKIKRLTAEPKEQGKNLFFFDLPVTKKRIEFKFLTGHDQNEIETKEKRMKEIGIKTDGSITSYLENVIVSVDGVSDKNKIHHFVKNMPARDSRVLRKFIRESEPGIDMSWEYNCSNCGTHNNFTIPMTSEFFWPST